MSFARAATLVLAAGALAVSAACGDVYAEPGGEPLPPPEFSADASAVLFPRELPPQCPARRPRENTSCSVPGSTCEYGASPDMQCNKTFQCVSDPDGAWWLERPTDTCRAAACPNPPGVTLSLDGQPCEIPAEDGGIPSDTDEIVCPMADGICACTTGPGGSRAHPRRWVCVRPQIADCSAHRPLAGSPCTGNVWCDYGSCKFKRGVAMECNGEMWLTGGAPCN